MNESAIDYSMRGASRQPTTAGKPVTRSKSAYGYSVTVSILIAGWLVRDMQLVSPKSGIGYWLGIIGGSMMLLLLLYPLRKRIRIFRVLGSTAHWFRIHMILGILGPLLVLFHSNFQLGSFNSRVAMFCMLLVAGSGVVGRHIYARIHRGLYGGKTNLNELRQELELSLKRGNGMATLLPEFSRQLENLAASVQGDQITGALSTRSSLSWAFRKHLVSWSLKRAATRELRARAATSPAIARDYRRLKKASTSYVRKFVRQAGRVAQFTLYERLFSIWHVLHLPLFFMMVASSLLHVLAVHMY